MDWPVPALTLALALLLVIYTNGTSNDADRSPISQVTMDSSELDEQYRGCLLDQGFDPQGVQVILGANGVPVWVKTGNNVPSGLHGYCFEQIGGTPTLSTSYGVPIDNPTD